MGEPTVPPYPLPYRSEATEKERSDGKGERYEKNKAMKKEQSEAKLRIFREAKLILHIYTGEHLKRHTAGLLCF